MLKKKIDVDIWYPIKKKMFMLIDEEINFVCMASIVAMSFVCASFTHEVPLLHNHHSFLSHKLDKIGYLLYNLLSFLYFFFK